MDVSGGQIAVAISGAGAPVVMLHAGVADHHMWDGVVPELEQKFTVIRPDFRGFGASPAPQAGFRHRDDVLAMLDHLNLAQAHVVGASMGGVISMELALAAPDRVTSLILLAPGLPGHDWSTELREYFDAEERAVLSGDMDAAVELNLATWVRGPRRDWSDDTRAIADAIRTPVRTALVNMAQTEEHEKEADLSVRESLPHLSVPTLVAVAEADVADFIQIGAYLAANVAHARSVRVPDTGHLIALERPAQTARLITEFLAELA